MKHVVLDLCQIKYQQYQIPLTNKATFNNIIQSNFYSNNLRCYFETITKNYLKGKIRDFCLNRGGQKLAPDIFALVTCADCYMFMPTTQFKVKPNLSVSANKSSSSILNGKKHSHVRIPSMGICSTCKSIIILFNISRHTEFKSGLVARSSLLLKLKLNLN